MLLGATAGRLDIGTGTCARSSPARSRALTAATPAWATSARRDTRHRAGRAGSQPAVPRVPVADGRRRPRGWRAERLPTLAEIDAVENYESGLISHGGGFDSGLSEKTAHENAPGRTISESGLSKAPSENGLYSTLGFSGQTQLRLRRAAPHAGQPAPACGGYSSEPIFWGNVHPAAPSFPISGSIDKECTC